MLLVGYCIEADAEFFRLAPGRQGAGKREGEFERAGTLTITDSGADFEGIHGGVGGDDQPITFTNGAVWKPRSGSWATCASEGRCGVAAYWGTQYVGDNTLVLGNVATLQVVKTLPSDQNHIISIEGVVVDAATDNGDLDETTDVVPVGARQGDVVKVTAVVNGQVKSAFFVVGSFYDFRSNIANDASVGLITGFGTAPITASALKVLGFGDTGSQLLSYPIALANGVVGFAIGVLGGTGQTLINPTPVLLPLPTNYTPGQYTKVFNTPGAFIPAVGGGGYITPIDNSSVLIK